jgi:hypothetical protein
MTNDVVKTHKEGIRGKHLEMVRADVERAEAIRNATEQVKAEICASIQAERISASEAWANHAAEFFMAATGPMAGSMQMPPRSSQDLRATLTSLSASLSSSLPTVSGVFGAVAAEADTTTVAGETNLARRDRRQ